MTRPVTVTLELSVANTATNADVARMIERVFDGFSPAVITVSEGLTGKAPLLRPVDTGPPPVPEPEPTIAGLYINQLVQTSAGDLGTVAGIGTTTVSVAISGLTDVRTVPKTEITPLPSATSGRLNQEQLEFIAERPWHPGARSANERLNTQPLD